MLLFIYTAETINRLYEYRLNSLFTSHDEGQLQLKIKASSLSAFRNELVSCINPSELISPRSHLVTTNHRRRNRGGRGGYHPPCSNKWGANVSFRPPHYWLGLILFTMLSIVACGANYDRTSSQHNQLICTTFQ